ncbi:MAG TPA: carbonic anhydrase [Gemmataceae bacterium]|nr:carbonic anhydrase [Gemmataceae bacterium]
MRTKCIGTMIAATLALWTLTTPSIFAQEKPAVTAEEALQRLKKGNEKFVADPSSPPMLSAERRQEVAKGQHPFAIILTCADSRLAPEHIFNQGLGDIFVLRVAGNIADPYVLGSMEFAVSSLNSPLIVVLGHSKCGAVAAAMGENKPAGNLGKLIAEVHVGKDLPSEKPAALDAAIANNVRHQAELLTKRSDVVKEFVDHKKVRIVSGVYSLESGKVTWLEEK